MIEYKGQMKMSFSVGPYEDFINEANLVMCKTVEASGNVMPALEMVFKAGTSKIIPYLNETVPLKVQMGVNEIKFDTEYTIIHKHFEDSSRGWYTIQIVALMNNQGYLLTPQRRTWGNCTSDGQDVTGLEIIMTAAHENFSAIETNIEKSEDCMLRVQYGISNKQFIDEVWETLYTPDTFVLAGITTAGKFKLTDVKSLAATDPKWKFTYKPAGNRDIVPEKTFVRDNSGVNNFLYGYIRQREFFDEDSGDAYVSTTGNTTYLSMSENFSRSDIWMLNTQMARNENMYNEYWEARDTNLSNLALFSSVNTQFLFKPDWKDIEVLDLAYIEICGPDGTPEEAFSGLALVSGVSRIYANKQIRTYVSLNREGFNQIL